MNTPTLRDTERAGATTTRAYSEARHPAGEPHTSRTESGRTINAEENVSEESVQDEVDRLIEEEQRRVEQLRKKRTIVTRQHDMLLQLREERRQLEEELAVEGSGRNDPVNDPRPTRQTVNTGATSRVNRDELNDDHLYEATPGPRERPVGKPKFRDLPAFKGGSLREVSAFIAGAERRFRMDKGHSFRDDISKIDYCVLAFERGPASTWERFEKEEGGIHQISWGKFKEWLEDSVQDKANRPLDAAIHYQAARRRPGQSVDDFANYLEVLEAQIEIRGEEAKKNLLYGKLDESLQERISNYNELPTTRRELISLATRLEQTARLGKGRNDTDQQRTLHSKRKRDDNDTQGGRNNGGRQYTNSSTTFAKNEGSKGPASNPNNIPLSDKCTKCGSSDHRLPKCPDVECYKCKEKGHIAPYCPRNKGKGPARQ